MVSKIGIEEFYKSEVPGGDYKFKQEVEDFVVYEINTHGICKAAPLLNLEEYYKSKSAFENIPDEVPKEERKAIYDATKHYPFLRLTNVNGKFVIEPSKEDIYVFTLMKYNLNTTDAAWFLAKNLGVSLRHVQFSGNKDKRAITFQEISIICSFEKLFNYAISLNKNKAIPDLEYTKIHCFNEINSKIIEEIGNTIHLESYEANDRIRIFDIRKGSSKRMGENVGNKFVIKIRGLESLSNQPRYFINYYGQQRFGRDLNNHLVGSFILEQKFDEALDAIMQSEEVGRENPGNNEGNTSDTIDGASEKKQSSVQRYICRMRERNTKSKFIVYGLDRLTRMMYMHAYQSYVFNCDVNIRMETREVQSGDLVFQDNQFIEATKETPLEDIYIPLEVKADKFLKGGHRKMIEEIKDFSRVLDGNDVVVTFSLNKSCYATCALREIIGNFPYDLMN